MGKIRGAYASYWALLRPFWRETYNNVRTERELRGGTYNVLRHIDVGEDVSNKELKMDILVIVCPAGEWNDLIRSRKEYRKDGKEESKAALLYLLLLQPPKTRHRRMRDRAPTDALNERQMHLGTFIGWSCVVGGYGILFKVHIGKEIIANRIDIDVCPF